MNPLVIMLNQTERSKWYEVSDFSLIVGYQMKVAGFDWRTHLDLVEILLAFWEAGAVEHLDDDMTKIRFKEGLYDALSV